MRETIGSRRWLMERFRLWINMAPTLIWLNVFVLSLVKMYLLARSYIGGRWSEQALACTVVRTLWICKWARVATTERRASSGKAKQVLSRRCAGAFVISGTSRYTVVYMHTPIILWRFDAGIYVIMTSGFVSWDHLDLDVLGKYTDDNDDRTGADLDNCTSSEEEPQDEPHEKGGRQEHDAQQSKPKASHEKQRPKCIYACPVCGREYQSVSGFRGHMVKKHSRPDLKGVSECSIYFDFVPITSWLSSFPKIWPTLFCLIFNSLWDHSSFFLNHCISVLNKSIWLFPCGKFDYFVPFPLIMSITLIELIMYIHGLSAHMHKKDSSGESNVESVVVQSNLPPCLPTKLFSHTVHIGVENVYNEPRHRLSCSVNGSGVLQCAEIVLGAGEAAMSEILYPRFGSIISGNIINQAECEELFCRFHSLRMDTSLREDVVGLIQKLDPNVPRKYWYVPYGNLWHAP